MPHADLRERGGEACDVGARGGDGALALGHTGVMRATHLALVGLLVLAGCSSDPSEPVPASTSPAASGSSTATASGEATPDDLYPDVLAATATKGGDGTWQFSATVSSPYDTPERYADAWRVLAPDGTELGIRVLAHDHAGEQPFTRSLSGVEVPAGVEVVTIEGRDQVNGWGGATVQVQLES
jgi:hypothetical protein